MVYLYLFFICNKIIIKEKGSLSYFKFCLIFLNIIKKCVFNLFFCYFLSIFIIDVFRFKILMIGNIDLICKLN